MREHPVTLKCIKCPGNNVKIFKLGQFAGKNSHIRSSETTRETSSAVRHQMNENIVRTIW